jgi:hypothetical protein
MLLIKGYRTAKIKTYTDHNHQCRDCKDFDLTVKVYKEYYHFFFIPMAPTGSKTVKIRCNKCGEPFRSDSINKQYESKTRIPIYLYTGTLLVSALILVGFAISIFSQNKKTYLVSDPKVGDVYLVSNKLPQATSYYFLKVVRMSGDTVIVYHNDLDYNQSVSELNPEDYFVSKEVAYTKDLLKQMLERGMINAVERDYNNETGFNRIK